MNALDFAAIDVETSNPDMASICQIGVVKFSKGKQTAEWSSLINPEDYFHPMNEAIHGISENEVSGSPTFPEVIDTLRDLLRDTVCVCHTHFDRISLAQAHAKYGLKQAETVWLDSARVARRTWKECAKKGYGLAAVCQLIGYEFKHHDALEDAKACGQVLLSAMDASGLERFKFILSCIRNGGTILVHRWE